MQQLNEGFIPYSSSSNLYQMKAQSQPRMSGMTPGFQPPVHQDNQFLESVAGEIYLAITEEKIEEDFITRLNGIIVKYHKQIMDSNLPAIVGMSTTTFEITQSEYMRQNREIAIATLNQRLNSVL